VLKKSDMAELNDTNKSNMSRNERIKTGQQYPHLQEEVTEGKILHSGVRNLYCSPRMGCEGETPDRVACDVNTKIG
jgi:hypothetical protein